MGYRFPGILLSSASQSYWFRGEWRSFLIGAVEGCTGVYLAGCLQECISLAVFAVIANIMFQGQSLHWNHILAFLLIICAVYLVFMK